MSVAFSVSATVFPARICDVVKQAAIYFFGLMALIFAVLLLYTVLEDTVSIPIANLISYSRGLLRRSVEADSTGPHDDAVAG